MSDPTSSSAVAPSRESGGISDLTFLCNGVEFKVHKAVVCSQSPMIRAATESFAEGRTNVIDMSNFDHKVVTRLVQFMYTGDYSFDEHRHGAPDQHTPGGVRDEAHQGAVPGRQSQSEKDSVGGPSRSPAEARKEESILDHIRVNSIGDYYGVEKLVSLANRKIEQLLKDARTCIEVLPAAIDAAPELTGDQGVRRILAAATAANLPTLLQSNQFKTLGASTAFSVEVLQSCAREIESLKRDNEVQRSSLNELNRARREHGLRLNEIYHLSDKMGEMLVELKRMGEEATAVSLQARAMAEQLRHPPHLIRQPPLPGSQTGSQH